MTIYHGFEIIPIGRRFDSKPRVLNGLHARRISFGAEGTLSSMGKRASPFVEKVSAARATTKAAESEIPN